MPEIVAAIASGPGRPLALRPMTIGAPRQHEVLVRIVAVGLCATDLHARDGQLPMPLPAVLGHEGAGRVEAVGSEVSVVTPGDSVVIGWPWCGTCRNCEAGHPRYCEQFLSLCFSGTRPDGSTALRVGDQPVASHFFGQSSFGTLALADERSLVRVADKARLELLAPLGCGFATGAGAVLNALTVPAGSSLAVFGPGAVGLAAVMAARLAGCSEVIAVGRNDMQLTLARELGATAIVDTRSEDPVTATTKMTGGGADFTVECTGNSAVARQAVDALRPLGTCALVGAPSPGGQLTLDHAGMILGRRVVGVNGGDGQSRLFIGRLISLHAEGRFPVDRLITTYPFASINDAINDVEQRKTIKAVLEMEQNA